MTLINAIISSPEDLDFRLHLRNEFMRIGLLDVLEVRIGRWITNGNGQDTVLIISILKSASLKHA